MTKKEYDKKCVQLQKLADEVIAYEAEKHPELYDKGLYLDSIYISGQMTGLPDFNYPKFFEVEKKIVDTWDKHLIFNPARIDELFDLKERTNTREWYLTKALDMLLCCNSIVMLNGWQHSAGARLEFEIAKELKMQIYDENLQPYKVNILEEADRLVNGPRQQSYGHPKDNFTDIGRMWGTLLDLPDIPPEKVGLMMVCLKACREKYQHKLDNLTDGAGFFKTIQLIKEKQ